MRTLDKHSGKMQLIVAALVVTALASCGTSQQHAPETAAVTPAPAPEVAPPHAQAAHAKTPKLRAQMSQEVSAKLNTATVLAQIHQANLMEIELGKMAGEKGSGDLVRAYGNQLVQDRTNIDKTVVSMAEKGGKRNVVHQSAREVVHEKSIERKLTSAKGTNFDKLFLQQASADHERLIRELQRDREDASDDQLESLIDKTIPILKQDRELAQILMKKERSIPNRTDRTHV